MVADRKNLPCLLLSTLLADQMTSEISPIISQMKTWDTKEIEDSFLSSCVFFLESEKGDPASLSELVTTAEDTWFAEPHKRAVFYVIKKISLSSKLSTFVVPGSIAVMAQKMLSSMGYDRECQLVESVTTSPSMFFDIDVLSSVIPLWRIKLARNRLRQNTERILDCLNQEPDQKVLEEELPSLIESQQDIWDGAASAVKRDDEWNASIDEVLSPLPEDISVSTGIRVLDDAIQGGIAKKNSPFSGRLIVVAARPSMGKSAFAVCLASQLADSHGDVAFFSLEMSRRQVQYRSISCHDYLSLKQTGKLVDPIRANNLRSRTYTAAQRERLESYRSSSLVKRFHIFDANEAINSVVAKVKLLNKTRANLCAVFIDYLQLIEGCSGDANNTEASNIGNVTRALKKLATATGVDIFLLSQVNRGVENRTDKMPNMSDLRASGRIEEDADIVMFLLRPYYYDQEKDPYELAISVAKNRHGICGTLACSVDLQSSVIFDRQSL